MTMKLSLVTSGGKKFFLRTFPTSDLLLYLVSAYSLASENCNKELGIALDEKITVIPIILGIL